MLKVLDRTALRSMFLLDGAACLSIHVSAPMLLGSFLNGPLQVDPRYRPTNGRMVSQCLWSHRALSYSNDISNININATREVSRREYSKLCENTILKYYLFVRIAFLLEIRKAPGYELPRGLLHAASHPRQDMTYTAAIVLPRPSMVLMSGSFALLRASASYVLSVMSAKSQPFMSPTCRSHGHVILQENPRLTLRDLTTFRGWTAGATT